MTGADNDAALHALARAAGIMVDWTDARNVPQRVGDATLRAVLEALGCPAGSPGAIAQSLQALADEAEASTAPLVTGVVDEPVRLAGAAAHGARRDAYQIILEQGETIDGVTALADSGECVVPALQVPGYHRLILGGRERLLAIAPARAFSVGDACAGGHAARVWGIAAQVYSLRRHEPTGIGDFTALAQLATGAAQLGAQAIGINPVHAGFTADPGSYSPYAPSSRLFLNPLYVDPAATFGAPAVSAARDALGVSATLAALDGAPFIDWPAVAGARIQVLRYLFERHGQLLSPQLLGDLRRFRDGRGEALWQHAVFEALDAHFRPHGWHGWRDWPAAFHDPRSAAVHAFAAEHAEEVEFHIFGQWLAARGLSAAQASARQAGMGIGIVNDLAVGTDPGGSHAWSRPGEIIKGLVCGAPPDIYNPLGQSWGLSAFSPVRLKQSGFRAFLEMVRAALAYGGGVRIDHVLGYARMWLIPDGASARDGAYLAYPLEDLLRLLALESWRNRAVIVGENLGTVPPGFNARLADSGVLGTTVLWFERYYRHDDCEGFTAPRYWPAAHLATTTTHDLPTVAGWWRGRDIEWRSELALLGADQTREGLEALRGRERAALWQALEHEALVAGPCPAADATAPVNAALAYVARSAAPLVLAPLEDLEAAVEQPNLPGTVAGHPNWQRRQARPVLEFLADPEVNERITALRAERSDTP